MSSLGDTAEIDQGESIFVIIITLVALAGLTLCIIRSARARRVPPREVLLEQRRRQRELIRRTRLRELGILDLIDGETGDERSQTGSVVLTAEEAEERRSKLLQRFAQTKVQTVVTAGQFLTGAGVGDDIEQQQQSAEKNNNDEMAKKQLLKLPNRRHPQPDIIPNRCAICLESYEVGEHIVWSENEQCQHAFHQDCILDYLVRLEDTSKNPCPCCRQQFCQRVICTEVEPTKE